EFLLIVGRSGRQLVGRNLIVFDGFVEQAIVIRVAAPAGFELIVVAVAKEEICLDERGIFRQRLFVQFGSVFIVLLLVSGVGTFEIPACLHHAHLRASDRRRQSE